VNTDDCEDRTCGDGLNSHSFHTPISDQKLPDPENPHFGANVLLLSLKMPKLLPFEVAIGRNANFQIFGEKGVNVKIHHRDPRCYINCASCFIIQEHIRSNQAHTGVVSRNSNTNA